MSSRIDETGRVCADKTASRNLIENMLSFCVVITLFCQCVSLVHCQGYISLSAWIPAWCWEVGYVYRLFVRSFDLPRAGWQQEYEIQKIRKMVTELRTGGS